MGLQMKSWINALFIFFHSYNILFLWCQNEVWKSRIVFCKLRLRMDAFFCFSCELVHLFWELPPIYGPNRSPHILGESFFLPIELTLGLLCENFESLEKIFILQVCYYILK